MVEIKERDFSSALTKVFAANGLSSLLSMERMELFYRLTERMLCENEKYNLTAITDIDKIILNHYADCCSLSAKLKKGATVIDVGCGAGFPSLPLAIVRPDLMITAMDSTAKRVNYVAETAAMLGLMINPTVSVSNTLSPQGSSSFLVVGSSVANSLSSERTPAPVSALSNVDLPALV